MFQKRLSTAQLRRVALALFVGSLFSFGLGQALGHRANIPFGREPSAARVEQAVGAVGNTLTKSQTGQTTTLKAALKPASAPAQHAQPLSNHDGTHQRGHKHEHAYGDQEGQEGQEGQDEHYGSGGHGNHDSHGKAGGD